MFAFKPFFKHCRVPLNCNKDHSYCASIAWRQRAYEDVLGSATSVLNWVYVNPVLGEKGTNLAAGL